jgi:hypothetical protein
MPGSDNGNRFDEPTGWIGRIVVCSSMIRGKRGWSARLLAMIRAKKRDAKRALRMPPTPSETPEGCVGVQTWGPLPAKPPGVKR